MAFSVYYVVSDAKGDTSTVTVPIPDTTDVADAALFVEALGPLIGALTDGALESAGINVEVDASGIGGWAAASTLSDVQEKARFAFRTAGGFLKSLSLPTFIESKLVNSGAGKEVDLTDGDVSAFVTAMEDGLSVTGLGGTGSVFPSDYRGDDITTLVEAREAWGKYRR